MTKRIFIIGHMGAGKFVFTEALAKKLGWQLIDANPSLERYIGRHTREILGEAGEASFNRSMADVIKHACTRENIVILLEECTVTSEECRSLLANEFVVYLKASIPTQLGRMKHGATQNQTGEIQHGRVSALPIDDLQKFLEKQHDERDPLYEKVASLIVESNDFSNHPIDTNNIIERDVEVVMRALRCVNYSFSEPKIQE